VITLFCISPKLSDSGNFLKLSHTQKHIVAFRWQERLHEITAVFRYTYIAYLVLGWLVI